MPAASVAGLAFEELRQEASTCTACPLARERTQVVFGDGKLAGRCGLGLSRTRRCLLLVSGLSNEAHL